MYSYLEYRDSKTEKFWQIQVDGAAHTVLYGKIGAKGRSSSKDFASKEEALESAEKLVQQKIKKGYSVVKKKVSPASSSSKKAAAKSTASKSKKQTQAPAKSAAPAGTALSRAKAALAATEPYTPVPLKTIEESVAAGGTLSKEYFDELAALFFETKDRKKREYILSLLVDQASQKLQKYLNDKPYFADELLVGYICGPAGAQARCRIFRSQGASIRSLYTRLRSVPDELALFPETKDIDLDEAFLPEFPPVLLEMHGLRNIHLDSSKIQELPPEIGKLSQLEELRFHRNRLKTLPESIGRLKELRVLRLSKNLIEDLPESLCDLEKLEEVNCENNSGFPGTELTKLFNGFFEAKTPVLERKVLFNLVLGKNSRAAELASPAHLVDALNSPFAVVRANAVQALNLKLKPEPKLSAGASIAFLGKFNFSTKPMEKRLKEKGYRVSKKLSAETDCVVLGEKPGDFDIASFSGMVLPDLAFQKWIDRIDTPYLQDSESLPEGSTENLRELMESPHADNRDLALEIMKSGGIPPEHMTDVLGLAYMADDPELRKKAMTLLKKHASAKLRAKLATRVNFRTVRSEEKMDAYLEDFAAFPEIDPQRLVRWIFAGTKLGVGFALRHGDEETQRKAIQSLLREDSGVPDGRLDLNNMGLHELPTVLGEFSNIIFLDVGNNEFTQIPKVVLSLAKLRWLKLYNNELGAPGALDGLERLKDLSLLDLCGNRLTVVPPVSY